MEGRPWLFRKYLILFERLRDPIARDQIQLTSSPYWIRFGPCDPEFDKKDLMHAVGSTFGGVIRSEVQNDYYRVRVHMDVQKPLDRGLQRNYTGTSKQQCEWNDDVNSGSCTGAILGGGRILSSWKEGLMEQTDRSGGIVFGKLSGTMSLEGECSEKSKKSSWKRLEPTIQTDYCKYVGVGSKRKIGEEEGDVSMDKWNDVAVKKLKFDGDCRNVDDEDVPMRGDGELNFVVHSLGSAASKMLADRAQ
ncbi:hypothetical protein EPI10_024127 [Gossypium australe]|uniref:DUF4283 domain-containing protein n=1 Tax=Gossypium australe TaxID=47621 RepID=A0A5B6VXV2_9ROSI|nr:hypothetical protein EPI10_024127 [Gossypium australe]